MNCNGWRHFYEFRAAPREAHAWIAERIEVLESEADSFGAASSPSSSRTAQHLRSRMPLVLGPEEKCSSDTAFVSTRALSESTRGVDSVVAAAAALDCDDGAVVDDDGVGRAMRR